MTIQLAIGVTWDDRAPCRASDGDQVVPTRLAATLVATLEEALVVAYRLLGQSACAAYDGLGRDVPGHGVLSRREAEVLRLLAAGMSNRQVAEALYLSPSTVQRHIANLYPKIGVHCRAEATAYALRCGFV